MLEVDFAGLKVKNPLLLSSAPPTMDGDHIQRAILSGWGGAVTKTIGLDKDVRPDVRPRLAAIKKGSRLFGMENIELMSTHSLDWWEKELRIAQSVDAPLIVSIMAVANREDWDCIARWAEKNGADMLELNLSCPHGTVERGRGMAIGQYPHLVESVTRWVVESVEIPVMVKLTPNVTDITEIAEAAEKGGAHAISAINTVRGLVGIDVYDVKPLPAVGYRSTYGGNCGPAVRPIGLRCVSEISKTVQIPVSGIGGIDSWENVIEYIMVGASTVQVCTAVMWYGFDIVKRWIDKIKRFMTEQGYDSIEDMIGIANQQIGRYEELKADQNVIAKVDVAKCVLCKQCEISCRDGAFGAIKQTETQLLIDRQKCGGCGLCMLVCPQNAITMTSKARSR